MGPDPGEGGGACVCVVFFLGGSDPAGFLLPMRVLQHAALQISDKTTLDVLIIG